MRLITTSLAAAFAATVASLSFAPDASAQHYGYRHHGYKPSYGYRYYRPYYGYRSYGYGYRRHYGYRGYGYRRHH